MDQTFMKTKPVFRLLVKMSLPAIVSMLVNSLYHIVDSIFVAKISEDAMTALSLIFPIQNLLAALAIGIAVGMNVIIAYFLGADELLKARSTATLGTIFNIITCIVASVIGIAILPSFLKAFTKNAEIISYGMDYSIIVFAFTFLISITLSYEKIYQAVGRVNFAMFSTLFGVIANIILDPIFIFGLGKFPALGIKGAAWATVIGFGLSAFVCVIYYFIKPINVKFGIPCKRKESLKYLKRTYAVGVPVFLSLALPSALVAVLNYILSGYSTIYVVILGAYFKLQTFLYMTSNGIVQGMRPIIGYNYGAKEHARVNKIYYTALILSIIIMAIGTIISLAIPGELISLFSNNSTTIIEGAKAFRIISIGFVISSFSVASIGALEGLGKGFPSLIISLLRSIGIIVPLAFLLSTLFGVAGVWHSFWITEVICALIAYIVFKFFTKPKEENLIDSIE